MRFIDIGANLTDPVFQGIYRGKQKHQNDYNTMLDRAKAVGVEKIIITGGTLSECRHALELARNDPTNALLYSTIGVHPTRCNEFEKFKAGPEAYFAKLLDLAKDGAKDGKIVATGEFGLDYDRLQFCSKETQLQYFEKQFELAEATGLPLFLHNRNTGDDFYEMIRKHRSRFQHGVVHSFTGSKDEAQKLLALDLYIGINGCSLKTEENLQVAKSIPLDRVMIETDAPWCDIRSTHAGVSHVESKWSSKKPEKYEGEGMIKGRNEPCAIIQVLEILAALHNMDKTELAHLIYKNTHKVFFNSSK